MRRNWCLAAAAILLAACSDPSSPGSDDEEFPIEPVRGFTIQEAALAQASVSFGLELMRQVAADESKHNLMLSPLSVSMALGMTMNGAAGATWDGMREALHFRDLTEAQINAAYKGLIAQLRARDPEVNFKLANSVWHEQSLQVKQPFLDAAAEWFDADVNAIDFAAPGAPVTISKWAEKETNGRIKDLIKQISRDEVMFLVNATYFKAPWASPFEKNLTRNGTFHGSNGNATVRMMMRDGNFRWLQNDDLLAAELLYGDSAFSMVVLMPRTGTLSSLSGQLTQSWWSSTIGAMHAGRVMLTMPRFTFSYDVGLKDALTDMGMGVAFDHRSADFSRIADDGLYITRVQHSTFIAVDEEGTEAAAATAVGIGIVSMPPSITFDRPFLFAIRERESGTILFIGRVGDPKD